MAVNYKFQATVTNGKINLARQAYFNQYVKSLEGKSIEVIVQKKSSARTIKQNAYFHGVVCKYWGDDVGCDVATMKEILKGKFLKQSIEIKGKEVEYIRGTSTLKVDEMGEFIDQCKKLGIEYGILMPGIDEVDL